MSNIVRPEDVTAFWFGELEPKNRFEKNKEIDRRIAERFLETHLALSAEVPEEWRASAEARLALIIVFDQFPRNMFRNSPHAFATDPLALREARSAIDGGLDSQVAEDRRLFFYLPFEHSERMEDQERCIELVTAFGDRELLKYAVAHRDVIKKYGRFPHRNAILARVSTPEEEAYLAKPGSGF